MAIQHPRPEGYDPDEPKDELDPTKDDVAPEDDIGSERDHPDVARLGDIATGVIPPDTPSVGGPGPLEQTSLERSRASRTTKLTHR